MLFFYEKLENFFISPCILCHFRFDIKSEQGGGGNFTVAKRKLNYRFHNPNPVEVTAEYILKVMIEANVEKVEKVLQEEMEQRREKAVNTDN